ncbi:MAG: hypothetical protein PWP03_391 [Candidatus Woesearchaeota archaeon]|nr:hypothetical protein [Candidatus Woesearchaeota archaeon]
MNSKTLKIDLFFIVLTLVSFNIACAADYVFTINEGEKIKVLPKVLDFDNDSVQIIYSYPLNSSGEWQTTYSDAGVYLTKVIATDGLNKDIKTVKIIVKNVDRPPEIKTSKEHYFVEENKTLSFGISTFDPDGDNVSLEIVNAPNGSTIKEGYFIFAPGFNFVQKNWFFKALQAAGLKVIPRKSFYVTIAAKSNNLTTTKSIKITVIDSNRPPEINKEIEPIIAKELDKIKIDLKASDPDKDWLFYKVKGWIDSKEYKTKLGDAGKHHVTVTLTDGIYERKYVQDIIIKRNNFAPEITNLKKDKENVITLREGESRTLKLKTYDKNKDTVRILSDNLPNFAKIEGTKIIFHPNYTISNKTNTAVFKSTITASDGNLKNSYNLTIYVKDVNLKPKIINYSPEIYTKQRVLKPITFEINANDKDNDKLTYEWSLPGFVKVKTNEGRLTFKPTTIGKKKISVKVCDEANTCVKHEWTLNVYTIVRR